MVIELGVPVEREGREGLKSLQTDRLCSRSLIAMDKEQVRLHGGTWPTVHGIQWAASKGATGAGQSHCEATLYYF